MQWTDDHAETVYQDEGPPFDYVNQDLVQDPDDQVSPTLTVDRSVSLLHTPYLWHAA